MTDGAPFRRRDSRADLMRRSAAWTALLQSAGVTNDDRVLVLLPTHLTTGADCYAGAIDGGWHTLARLGATLEDVLCFRANAVIGTPTDILRLAQGLTGTAPRTLHRVELVVVTGEPGGSLNSTRHRIEGAFGARCLDVYATTELGIVGRGCADGSMHLDDDTFIVQSVEPHGDGDAPPGRRGELLVTARHAGHPAPLVRYRTGDIVRLEHAPCACGNRQIRASGGILGRAVESVRIHGVDLLPSDIEDVVRRHPAVIDFRLRAYELRGQCGLEVQIQADTALASEGDLARVSVETSEDIRRSLGIRLGVDVLPPDAIVPQDAARRARRFTRQ